MNRRYITQIVLSALLIPIFVVASVSTVSASRNGNAHENRILLAQAAEETPAEPATPAEPEEPGEPEEPKESRDASRLE